MKSTIKTVLVVMIVMTMVEAKSDLENIIHEIRKELNELKGTLVFTMEKLEITEAELLELKTKNNKLEDFTKIADNDLNSSITELKASFNDLTSQNQKQDKDISILREPPFIHACGSHYDTLHISSKAIPYESLLYSSTNTEGGGLDISTGIFSSPWPGSYTVTWGLIAYGGAGEHFVDIYLRKNGKKVQESHHTSHYDGPSGSARDIGGRTLVLYLVRGDTLDLYCQDCSDGIYYTTFCVSLTTFDII